MSGGYYSTPLPGMDKKKTPPAHTTHAPRDLTINLNNKEEKSETDEASRTAPPALQNGAPALQNGAPPRRSTTVTQVSADLVGKSRPNVVTGVVTKVPSQRTITQPPTRTTHVSSKLDKQQQLVRLIRCFKVYLGAIDAHVAEAVQRTHRADDRLAETKLRQQRVAQYLHAINNRHDIGPARLGDPLARAARMENFNPVPGLRPPSGLADSGRSLLRGLEKNAGLRAGEFPLADNRRPPFALGDRGNVGEDAQSMTGEAGGAFGGQRKRRREEGAVHRSLSSDPGAVPGALSARASQAIASTGPASQRLRNNFGYPQLQASPRHTHTRPCTHF